jgi:hypothetical protein
MAEGAAGVDADRSICQSFDPVGTTKAVRAVVHDRNGVGEAQGLFCDPSGSRGMLAEVAKRTGHGR